MRQPFYKIALLLLLLMSSTNMVASSHEKELEAAYIYNFIRFSTWPELSLSEDFTICVITEDSPGAALKALETRSIDNRNISVRVYSTPENIQNCAVVYLPHLNAQLQQRLIDQVRNKPVLTISSGGNFVDRGGLISLDKISEDRKFRQITRLVFTVNLEAAKQANIKFSSKLLNLAIKVKQ